VVARSRPICKGDHMWPLLSHSSHLASCWATSQAFSGKASRCEVCALRMAMMAAMMAAMIGLCAPRPAGRHWPHPCVFRFNASRGGTMWHDQKYLHDNKKWFYSQDLVNHSGDTVLYNVIQCYTCISDRALCFCNARRGIASSISNLSWNMSRGWHSQQPVLGNGPLKGQACCSKPLSNYLKAHVHQNHQIWTYGESLWKSDFMILSRSSLSNSACRNRERRRGLMYLGLLGLWLEGFRV